MKRLFLTLLILTCLLCAALPGSADEILSPVDTNAVVSALKNPDWVVVDTRLNDSFNGWKLDGVHRGGHIPGAVDFSANWLKVEDDSLEQQLRGCPVHNLLMTGCER